MDNEYKIVIGKYAINDLKDIYDYIAKKLLNKEAAVKLLNKINDKFNMISFFPKSAQLINNEFVKNKNIRKVQIDNYIIFYDVDDENKKIIIIRILNNLVNYIDIL